MFKVNNKNIKKYACLIWIKTLSVKLKIKIC